MPRTATAVRGTAVSGRRRVSALVAAVGVVALLSGCGGEQVPQPTTAPSSSGASSESPSQSPSTDATTSPTPDMTTISFTDALGREFNVSSPTAADTDVEDERVIVRATLETSDDVLLLTAPETATWEVQSDSSALLQDADAVAVDGAAVFGGASVPGVRDVNNSRVRVEVSTGEEVTAPTPADVGPERVLEFRLEPRGNTEFPVDFDVVFAPQALDDLEWASDLEGGRSLQVFPTAWGRSGSEAASSAVWLSIIAREPEADTDVMDKQLRCHVLGAPDKASWNLEPWRPEVPYLDYLIARCNPT